MEPKVIRVTKIFRFEMAHALFGYNGPCKNVHGHSYELSVTVKGTPVADPNHPQCGMVIDFSELKQVVQPIIDELDHATALNALTPHANMASQNPLFGKSILLDYQPTCENLLIDIAARLSEKLPANIVLQRLKLKETPTSYAEWCMEDNLLK